MTKRILILAPKGLFIADMNAAQQSHIERAFGSNLIYNLPNMKEVGGKIIVDALAADSFDETAFTAMLPSAKIIGIFERNPLAGRVTLVDGEEVVEPNLIVHKALDATALQARQNNIDTHDQDGNVISSRAAKLSEFHNWAGWGDLFI